LPARARCGFGTYFWRGRFEDHWICEYWTGARWARVDAQLDEVQRRVLGIDFAMGNLIRELAALNDAEMLPWDMWGVMCSKDWTETHYALFDRVAELLMADSDDMHTIYENEPGLRVPRDMIVPGF